MNSYRTNNQQQRLNLGEAPIVSSERGRLEPPPPLPGVAVNSNTHIPSRILRITPINGINPTTSNTILSVITILLIGGFIFMGIATHREFGRDRLLNDEHNRLLAKLEGQFTTIDKQVAELARSTREINASLSLATKLRNEYGDGVCLISGTYILVDPKSGRPLRLPRETDKSLSENENERVLTPEGDGQIAKIAYEGTGFYVGDGYILSNRHVVSDPWRNDKMLELLTNIVKGKPRLTRLEAFFPGQSHAYPLKFELASSEDDLAVCTLNLRGRRQEIPILPLDLNADAIMIGQAVTMIGYPSGVDRLVALLPEKEVRRLEMRYRESEVALLGHLAENSLIKPLTSQGHIMDLHSNRIVYDATTAEGESGAPVFGPSGHVIGIHFGYFKENRLSNYAVPISKGLGLLYRAGWRPAE